MTGRWPRVPSGIRRPVASRPSSPCSPGPSGRSPGKTPRKHGSGSLEPNGGGPFPLRKSTPGCLATMLRHGCLQWCASQWAKDKQDEQAQPQKGRKCGKRGSRTTKPWFADARVTSLSVEYPLSSLPGDVRDARRRDWRMEVGSSSGGRRTGMASAMWPVGKCHPFHTARPTKTSATRPACALNECGCLCSVELPGHLCHRCHCRWIPAERATSWSLGGSCGRQSRITVLPSRQNQILAPWESSYCRRLWVAPLGETNSRSPFMPWQVESLARGSSVSRSHAWTTEFRCTARTSVPLCGHWWFRR